jgi:hypothetical protein
MIRRRDGLHSLHSELKKVDDVAYSAKSEKKILKERMKAAGLPDDKLDTRPLTGRAILFSLYSTPRVQQ